MPFSTPERRHISVSIISALLAATIFALDLRQPPGIAVPMLYVIPVLLSLWQRRNLDTIVAAGGTTLLTVGVLLFWRHTLTFDAGLANRAFAVVVLWVAALIVLRSRHTDRDARLLAADYRRSDSAARLSDARVHAILDTAVDAILVIDTRGIVQLVNPAVERLFGYSPDEVIGQNVSMLMPSPDRERHDGYLMRYLATGEKRIIGIGREVTGRRKNGAPLPLSLAVSETVIDGVHTFTGILHDLTAIKKAEAALRARSELARLGQMASMVAHEVRNPLAGIRGVLEILQSRRTTSPSDAAILGDLIERLDALNRFVEDLLVFSRPNELELVPTEVRTYVEHLVGLVRHDPRFAQVALDIDGPEVVIDLDPQAMERAILNVLQNAAQAIDGAGHVRITIDDDGAQCRIVINDTGPGIAPEIKERLFDPFVTTRHGGTGLGLAITRRAVEQHQGSIEIDSTPGAGTTVTISLPHPSAFGVGTASAG
ncbi:MAG TPA: PAS domain S-box protein [Vicinamibacterales bacterium]